MGSYAALMLSDLIITDQMLALCLLWPTAGALLVALLPGDRTRWVSAALGALVGTVLVVAVIAGLISGLAYLLSDPA
ncbi:MAG: hypothetical protein WKF79_01870 [Nocardioides sp.]